MFCLKKFVKEILWKEMLLTCFHLVFAYGCFFSSSCTSTFTWIFSLGIISEKVKLLCCASFYRYYFWRHDGDRRPTCSSDFVLTGMLICGLLSAFWSSISLCNYEQLPRLCIPASKLLSWFSVLPSWSFSCCTCSDSCVMSSSSRSDIASSISK